jgi:steroid delta-isomerase-like uncharacterized protein
MVWTVQSVIDSKDQMKFKVLLANWWSPSPEMGGYTNTNKNGKSDEGLTESETKTVIGKIVELVNLRKLDEMLEYFTDDVTAQTVGVEKLDKKGLRELFEGSFSLWSDGVYRVDGMISKGDTVVAEVHWTGVHTGEDYAGIPATGKRIEMVAVWIVDFKDGKIKVWKIFYNPDMAVQQLQE